MKHTEHNWVQLGARVLLAVGLGLGLSGCKSDSDRSMAQRWGDSQVAKGVKKKLSKDSNYKYPDVQPVVYEGTVQLTGYVDTPEHRQRAAELAAQAKGAREVVNNILLKPTPTGREQPHTNGPASSAPEGGSPAQEKP